MKIFPLIAAALLLASCSSVPDKDSDSPGELFLKKEGKEKAMEFFINGQILEAREKYEEAVTEYNKAINFDKSSGIYYSIAKNYLRLNKLAWAKQAAVKAIEMDSGNKEYVYLLAQIYTTGNSPDSAAACYERLIKDDPLDLTANFNLAEIYKSSKPLRALEILKGIMKITGPTPEVLFEIAAINERLGNKEETIKTIEDLLKINPSDAMLKKVLIESCISNKNYDKALKLIDEQLVIYPDDAGLLGYKGNIFVQREEWDKAKQIYLKIAGNPDVNHQTKIKIGIAFLAQPGGKKEASDAAREILKAVDKDTLDWQVKLYLGEIYLEEKNDSAAVNYYKEAFRLADWNVDILSRYGGLLFDSGRYEELNTEMEKGIKLFPDNYAVNLLYGLSLSQTDRHRDAKTYLQKAVRINPRDVMALTALGFSLNRLKEDDEALNALNRALEIEPDNIQALGMAGLIYEGKKEFEKSDAMYLRALAVDSSDIQILNNYAYSLGERGIDLDKALNMAKIAVSKEPKNSSYLDTIGWIYYKLGDYKKALGYIMDAINAGEKSAVIYEHLGDVYLKLNKKENALLNWKKALEIDPGNEKLKLKLEKELK